MANALIFPDYKIRDDHLTSIWNYLAPFVEPGNVLMIPPDGIPHISDRFGFFPAPDPERAGMFEYGTDRMTFSPGLLVNCTVASRESKALGKNSWFEIVDTVSHELIHRQQWRNDPGGYHEYYEKRLREILSWPRCGIYHSAMNKYEIDAHAYTEATRIIRYNGNPTASPSVWRTTAVFDDVRLSEAKVPDWKTKLADYKAKVEAYRKAKHPDPFIPPHFSV